MIYCCALSSEASALNEVFADVSLFVNPLIDNSNDKLSVDEIVPSTYDLFNVIVIFSLVELLSKNYQ